MVAALCVAVTITLFPATAEAGVLEELEEAWAAVKQVGSIVKTIFFISLWCASKAYQLMKYSIGALPNLSTWYLWVPLWIMWFAFLTQPKKIDTAFDTTLSKVGTIAEYVHNFVWELKFVGILLTIFTFPSTIVLWVLKNPRVSRAVISIALINVLVGKLGLFFSYILVMSMLTIWYVFLRSEEYNKHFWEVIRAKPGFAGWVRGIPILLLEDFIEFTPPKKTCPACNTKNDADKNFCKCGATLPSSIFKCKAPCRTVNDIDAVVCQGCGKPNPHIWVCPNCNTANTSNDAACQNCPTTNPNQAQNPFRQPAPPTPEACPNCGGLSYGSQFCADCGYRRPQPPSTINCPHCNTPNRLQARFCGNCTRPMTTSRTTTGGRTATNNDPWN